MTSAPPHDRDLRRRGRRYGLLILLDAARVVEAHPGGCVAAAECDIGRSLAEHGFARMSAGFYIAETDAVRSVLAVQDLAGRVVWFKPSLRDARLLRIEEIGDLGIAIR